MTRPTKGGGREAPVTLNPHPWTKEHSMTDRNAATLNQIASLVETLNFDDLDPEMTDRYAAVLKQIATVRDAVEKIRALLGPERQAK
jgi:hypothetical protein